MMQNEEEKQRGRVAPDIGAGGSHTQATSDPKGGETKETRGMGWADCEDDEGEKGTERDGGRPDGKGREGHETREENSEYGVREKEDRQEEKCGVSLSVILILRSSFVAQLFGHRHVGWNEKQVLSLSCIFGSFGVLNRFSCCWCAGGSSITILPLLEQIIRTFATVTIPVLCVLVNTSQCHDAVDFVQDSETEDPQLVAEPGVGRNHGKTMGKS